MAREWAFVLVATLLAALAQKCESDIFELECKQSASVYDPSPLSQRLLKALKKLRVNSETEPDELAAKIQEAAAATEAAKADNERADFHDIFQALSLVIQEKDARCPEELFDLIESFVGLRLKLWHRNDAFVVGPINRFLKAKIAPKLDECVNRVVNTYAGRKEPDVLEPLDGFFEAAYGPDWAAKLPKFEFMSNYDKINVESAAAFIKRTHVAGFDGRQNLAYKIKKFLDDKCERIQAFRDVAVLELVNAINCEGFPCYRPPRDAKKELPEKLLKIKNYYRICMHWRYSDFGWTRRFIKNTAHKYDLMQASNTAHNYDRVQGQRRWFARFRKWVERKAQRKWNEENEKKSRAHASEA
jgi:hypothetical protein